MKDKHIGLMLFLMATSIYVYFLLWAIMTPFLEQDNPLLNMFPPNKYALVLPLSGVILGASVVSGYIGVRAVIE